MPMLPIDLQVLFSQMNQVGKEQAVLKDGSAINQSLQGMQTVQNTEHEDNSVNQSKEIGEGLEKIKEEVQEKKKRQRQREEKEKKKLKIKNKNVFKDPDLGKHIDIIS